ncbi:MAG: PaaX family transcriptional regulator C-terminal domain-containing protein [Minisyncoccia bacterium]
MKQNFVSKRIKNITFGVLEKVSDLIFVSCVLLDEFIIYNGENYGKKAKRINMKILGCNDSFSKKHLHKTFYNIKKQELINKDFKISKEGREKLNLILPQYYKKRKWDGYWYLVSYDIPERYSFYRKILKSTLEDLNFGLLHKSVWISAFNFLNRVQKIVEKYGLYRFVFFSKSCQLNKPSPQIIAERIWKLNNINKNYEDFIKKFKSEKFSKRELIFRYLSILKKDPQLPLDLLPENWKGEEAFKCYKKICKNYKFILLDRNCKNNKNFLS